MASATSHQTAESLGAAAVQSSAGNVAKSAHAALERAPDIWLQTRRGVEAVIVQLKAAIRKEFAKDPALLAEIERNMNKLDAIPDALDLRLVESLKRAHVANDPAARLAELKNSKTILVGCFSYVASSKKLIAGIDANPFGIKSDLKGVLAESLRRMAQLVG